MVFDYHEIDIFLLEQFGRLCKVGQDVCLQVNSCNTSVSCTVCVQPSCHLVLLHICLLSKCSRFISRFEMSFSCDSHLVSVTSWDEGRAVH